MPKRYTGRDHNHPKYILKDRLNDLRNQLQSLPTKTISFLCDDILKLARQDGMLPAKHPVKWERHEMVQFCVDREELFFKSEWKKEMGWDFEECHNPVKYAQHVREQMKYQNERLITSAESATPSASGL